VNVHCFRHAPPGALGEALERFETQFRYPLGPGRSFRIAHGREYVTFFQAMGDTRLFVAERDGTVLGTLGAVVRPVRLPEGDLRPAVYLCDLKVDPVARGGRALMRLMGAAREELEIFADGRAYSVVMDGTRRTPQRYTGRAGVPEFNVVGQLSILRLRTRPVAGTNPPTEVCSPSDVEELQRRWTPNHCVPLAGVPAHRSQMEPVGLRSVNGSAAGILEDTRRGKRLIDQSGQEMISAHLSRFSYQTIQDGVRLLADALDRAGQLGFPAMFTSVPSEDAPAVLKSIPGTVLAPATIYACGFGERSTWRVDTSEI